MVCGKTLTRVAWMKCYSSEMYSSTQHGSDEAKSVKSTSPVTENHYKNGYVNYKKFIMTNEDNNHDTKYTNKNDTNNHNARELHE